MMPGIRVRALSHWTCSFSGLLLILAVTHSEDSAQLAPITHTSSMATITKTSPIQNLRDLEMPMVLPP